MAPLQLQILSMLLQFFAVAVNPVWVPYAQLEQLHRPRHHNDAGIIFPLTLVQKVCPSDDDPMLNVCILCFEGPRKQPRINLGVTAADLDSVATKRTRDWVVHLITCLTHQHADCSLKHVGGLEVVLHQQSACAMHCHQARLCRVCHYPYALVLRSSALLLS